MGPESDIGGCCKKDADKDHLAAAKKGADTASQLVKSAANTVEFSQIVAKQFDSGMGNMC